MSAASSKPVSNKGKRVLQVVTALVFLYLFAPIIWIVAFSFNKPTGKYNLQWKGFTLDNWLHPFADADLTSAFVRSLQVAAVSVTLATVMGSMMALALSKYRFRGNSGVDIFLVLPLTTPEIVLGASLLTMFIDFNDAGIPTESFWDRGMFTIIIAHTLFCLSFVALTVKARIRGFDWRLEEAAADLGAGPWRTFSRVTFPLILPGIFAAALLSFALSIDDYIITSFNKGQTNTMPIHIWDSFKVEFRPQVNVLASMILIVSAALLVGSSIVSSRRAK
ncbi:MAG: ABC transporter permease [Microthrixaceae bacterium]|jgi:spermidine/putrescine transport system permease protein|nr:ABC transporter permease [Actinomycetota bacterium]MBP6729891.1 ABC transporter permease [Microthrixaceae bacterium]HMS13073.1 ABC transporter permease [Microthrixaceae bacterium]HMT23361.1 ABC transporter permease [Microthrixaceae bacterium]HMT59514.1 ABC transporter permease [Microthrixaceae bacterium]